MMKEDSRSHLRSQTGGDETLMRDIWAVYLDVMSTRLASAREVCGRRDFVHLVDVSRAIVSDAQMVGDAGVAEAGYMLLNAARSSDGALADRMIELLRSLDGENRG